MSKPAPTYNLKGNILVSLLFGVFYTGGMMLLNDKTFGQMWLNSVITTVIFFCWDRWITRPIVNALNRKYTQKS